jgi:transaldolase
VRKVIEKYLAGDEPAAWAKELRNAHSGLSDDELIPLVYAVVCGRVGNDAALRFGAGRPWEVSLQLHMRLGADAEKAKRVGRYLRRMVPSGVVKVPFAPHHPHCLLVARDLEREGIPVNFTSTFSARQVVAVALLADVTLTNIFMGRINQGLKAALLGEHVDLEAQRSLLHLRREHGVKTLLIVASVREWQTFPRVAGCDAFTAPCDAIRGFMTQTEIAADEVKSQLETSYKDNLGIDPEVLKAAGQEAIERLYRVEPDLVRFLVEFRDSDDYRNLNDGDQLFRHFDRAGFGDLFHAPTDAEWEELRRNKLPNLQSELTGRLPMDTLYTLLADADFDKYQEEMDGLMRKSIGA